MATHTDDSLLGTHEVLNQPSELANYNLYDSDAALQEGVTRGGADWAREDLDAFGTLCGRQDIIEVGAQANSNPPVLHTHDRFGHRVDRVTYHPAYHALMKISVENQIHALPWNRPERGSHVARAAKHYMMTQVESGHICPITMTFAVVPALRHQPDVAEIWIPRATSDRYDQRFRPAEDKAGCILGMAMTEKQGGSDVRANTTRAVPTGVPGPGKEYLLTGHKWFCSAPMSDAFLVLAQTNTGLTCFLVPRWLPDGIKNRFFIQRLKDKLGNKSNASGEVEYKDTWGLMVGEEGRGVPTIIEMVNHTRLDCTIGSAAIMRQGVAHAIHNATHRSAFRKTLRNQPLMKNVLADLALESEAATSLMLRLTRGYDDVREDPGTHAFLRIATAIGKYWVCKRCPSMVYEALETHGGTGYVEENIMARHYREAPLGSIWEGSGNIMCLDVLRAMEREPETVPALLTELRKAKGANTHYDAMLGRVEAEIENHDDLEIRARRVVEMLALAMQAAQLVQHAPDFVADAFCASRLGGEWGREFGTLTPGTEFDKIIDRAAPKA